MSKFNRFKYAYGRAFEYRVKRLYEDLGYFVTRSAGSHGPADLIAIDKAGIMLIQCTTDPKIKTKEELRNLKQIAQELIQPCHAVLATHSKNKKIKLVKL